MLTVFQCPKVRDLQCIGRETEKKGEKELNKD